MLMLLIFSRTLRYLTLAISLKNEKRKNELTKFKGRTDQGPFKMSYADPPRFPGHVSKL